MTEWTWVDTGVALAIHDEQLAELGGASSVRYAGTLKPAMARPPMPLALATSARPMLSPNCS